MSAGDGSRARATAVGAVAVLLWALLAILTVGAAGVPQFQLLATSFCIAFLFGTALLAGRGQPVLANYAQPAAAWLVGVAGLFGFHAFYFAALANAPPAEASLIAYLWPVLIVLLSALLPGQRLRWFHLVGVLAGFAGAALLITDGGNVALRREHAAGYLAALGCALTWSSYSVVNRRFEQVPSAAVAGFCGAVALLGAVFHLLLEETVVPSMRQWLAMLGLGVGPVGAAFFFWDHGTKHGDIQTLAALSYAAPLLSTLILVVAGLAPATPLLALSCALVVGGAALAARSGGARSAERAGGTADKRKGRRPGAAPR